MRYCGGGVFNTTQEMGRKESNPLPSKEDNWIIRNSMRYQELDQYWKRIFQLEWESVCEGSKAIAALIVSEKGEIISEGRNKIETVQIPNPRVLHAEVEAIRNLNIERYPNVKNYTLVTGLEPCPMCMGTMVMGGLRNIIIGARDDYGGAMDLINHSSFLQNKKINITWMDKKYGDVQRALQAIKELLYNDDQDKLERMLVDFSVHNKRGVDAAKKMVSSGWFMRKTPSDYSIENVFDYLLEEIEQ